MTKADISARNRRNAQSSTGPRTSSGKALVSQNALRHGATAAPSRAAIQLWLGVILNWPDIKLEAALNGTFRMQTALWLATTEARLYHAVVAERVASFDPRPPEEFFNLIQELISGDRRQPEFRAKAMLLHSIHAEYLKEVEATRERRRLIKRYLREARAERNKARSSWIKVCGARERSYGSPYSN